MYHIAKNKRASQKKNLVKTKELHQIQ